MDVPPPTSGRDRSPLPDGALVRYQWMQATRAIQGNHRYLLFDDGRFHAAVNQASIPAHDGQVFDTPLPAEPTATLPPEAVEEVRELLATSGFADQPTEVADRARDGHVVVVTARVDGQVHEVAYRNADQPPVGDLSALYHRVMGDEASLDELADWFDVEEQP